MLVMTAARTALEPKAPPDQAAGRETGNPSELDRLAGLAPDAAVAELDSSPNGLAAAEAAARLARAGANELVSSRRSAVSVLLGQLRSPLLGLLLVAAVVSITVGEVTGGAIILAIMTLSVALGFFNEYRSEQTLASLRSRTGRRATALRDCAAVDIPAAELVPGDVCLLQTGDVVPADLRLLESAELTIDESALTGEAYPAEKEIAAGDGAPGAVHANCAYLGTVVRSGRGAGVVALTGMATRLGGVAGGLGERQSPTAFQRGLTSFSALLAKVTAALTVFIFIGNAALGKPALQALLFSLAIAVGLTPQLLPAIVTVSLSTGARRMARRSVLVKRLVAIEDLGDADVLFTDKTGTLTLGEIGLHEAVGPDDAPAPELVRLGLLSSELSFEHGGTPLGNALDLAIWRALEPGVAEAELQGVKRVATLPFTFERRRTSVVLDSKEPRRLLCKGAAEEVLGRCTAARVGGQTRPLTAVRKQVDATLGNHLDAGQRLLAVAERPVLARDSYSENDEQELVLRGFLVFADPPKADAAESIARLMKLGIELKVLTGDNERTTAHVCAQVGLPVKGVARGSELEGLSDEEVTALVARTTVFARVGPEQKAILVAAAQRNGDDVAFLGDGVNDAVALHRADVGISVDTGGRRRQGGGRRRPPREEPRRPCRRSHRGSAHLREHHEVRAHGDELELREHVQRGRRFALPPVPADAAEPDPAQQPALRHLRADDPDGLGRRGAARAAGTLGRPFHPALHGLLRPDLVRVRLPDLRSDDLGLRRWADALPHRLVRRIPRDAVARRVRDSHAARPVPP
jgi:P-type Mg2+ transporter